MTQKNELLKAARAALDALRGSADPYEISNAREQLDAAIKAEAERVEPVAFPFKHNGVRIAHKGHAAGLLNNLAKWMRRDKVGDYQTLELVAAYVDALEATPPAAAVSEVDEIQGVTVVPVNTELEAAAVSEPLSDAQKNVMALIDQQANDEGLWFVAQTITEAYLQAALRKLHEAVEAANGTGEKQ